MNRLQELRDDLCAEYRILTGNELSLYMDCVGLAWGSQWDKELSASVDESSFFVPILTPTFFARQYCRKELTQFLGKIERQDAEYLLLPILYSYDPRWETTTDPLIDKVFQYQYEDWTELRCESRDSSCYRKAIKSMALRIVRSNSELGFTRVGVTEKPSEMNEAEDEHELQKRFDSVQDSYDNNLAEATSLLIAVGDCVKSIGSIAAEGNKQIECLTRSDANVDCGSLTIEKLSSQLWKPAKDYDEIANKLMVVVFNMDKEIRFLTLATIENGEEQYNSMRELADAGIETKECLEGLRAAANDTALHSRVLSGPLAVVDQATVKCMAAIDVMLDWQNLFKEYEQKSK
jgi:hypothetical protein